jgi:hypothetical protein
MCLSFEALANNPLWRITRDLTRSVCPVKDLINFPKNTSDHQMMN